MSKHIGLRKVQIYPDAFRNIPQNDAVKFTFLNNTPIVWICTPIGGFGNHIRWMLTLDAKIQAKIDDPWTDKSWDYYTIDDKIDFIIDNIYGDFRTWHNWLNTEWAYRVSLNKVMPFVHNPPDKNRLATHGMLHSNAILCTVSPDLALRCYLKVNSSLNNATIDGFKVCTEKDNINIIEHATLNNRLLLNADILYTEVLDRDFYTSMIDYLGFDDNYESAAMIHSKWYQLHQKAEREFGDYVTNFYRPEANNNIGKTLNTAIGL